MIAELVSDGYVLFSRRRWWEKADKERQEEKESRKGKRKGKGEDREGNNNKKAVKNG